MVVTSETCNHFQGEWHARNYVASNVCIFVQPWFSREWSILTFSVWPFKSQVSAVARPLFNLNVHYGTVFFLLDINGVHLIGWLCLVDPLKSEFNHLFFTMAAVHKFSNFLSIHNSLLVAQTVARRRLLFIKTHWFWACTHFRILHNSSWGKLLH
jgi:hypothetical protein